MENTPLSDDAVTDLTYLSQFCEGDPTRMHAYTDLYIAAIPAFAQRLTAAATAQNLDELSGLMHSIKPKCMMMGMKKANDLRAQIEILCNNEQNTPDLYAQLIVFEEYLKKSVEELSGR